MSGTAIALIVAGLLLLGFASSVTMFVLSTRAWKRFLARLDEADQIFKSRWE